MEMETECYEEEVQSYKIMDYKPIIIIICVATAQMLYTVATHEYEENTYNNTYFHS